MAIIEAVGQIAPLYWQTEKTEPLPGFSVAPSELFCVVLLPSDNLDSALNSGVHDVANSVLASSSATRTRHYAQGLVKESGFPVCRRVVAVRRETLHPLASAISEVNGRFHLEWVGYSGKIVILIFDDATDALDYNCKVFDLVESVY